VDIDGSRSAFLYDSQDNGGSHGDIFQDIGSPRRGGARQEPGEGAEATRKWRAAHREKDLADGVLPTEKKYWTGGEPLASGLNLTLGAHA
jgi:hypothetical protein